MPPAPDAAASVVCPPCALCGSAELQVRYDFGPWQLLECPRCGLGQSQPLPTAVELARIYGEGYFTGAYDPSQNYVTSGDAVELWEATLNWIETHTTHRTLLDVGCGLGHFLRHAAQRGYTVRGLELSPWAAEFARTRLGLDVVTGAIDRGALDVSGAPFGVITMWSTLEHLAAPLGALDAVRCLLAAGGLLCIGVPNYEGWPVRLHGARAPTFKREHLFYYRFATLRRALAQAGFTRVERMVLTGGTGGGVLYRVAQQTLRTLGLSSQLMVAATP
jgi:2-polyprenyl-3-methyl-5-hydroxy-6-metoxy-1,4-benzoquinol methylase